MRLHYSPGSCALGVHVLLEEIGAPFTLKRVDFAAREQYGADFRAMNPKSKVPALQLDDGSALTEYQAIATYLAELHPEKKLIPTAPLARARMYEALDYVVGTIHTEGFRRVFRPNYFAFNEADFDATKARGREIAAAGLEILDPTLQDRDWLAGDFSIADSALFYVCYWAIDRLKWPAPARIATHYRRMRARPAVVRALANEGISK
ncbi:MAG: glutathione S-transferase N-terminal domain-containing protein [Pseudomonadota bacterium]|nr:glutathione S-transferase N-terminal domain-containing protein [Pseudomonadota bacterium]